MRTPGADAALAAGFLFTEGLIRGQNDILDIRLPETNAVEVALAPHVVFEPERFERSSFVSSSCGVCGKRSMAAVFAAQLFSLHPGAPRIASEIIHGLPAAQRAAQKAFHRTGGLHAAAAYEPDAQLRTIYEDVGRHNALDKLIGARLRAGHDASEGFVLVTSRASFEMVEKTAIFGAGTLVSISAPTSLAIERAARLGLTLVSVARRDGCIVFAGALAGELETQTP